jgi:rubrerythrin
METEHVSVDELSEVDRETIEEQLANQLLEAYQDEFASAANYLTLGNSLEGVLGEEVGEDLVDDYEDETEHAKELAEHLDEKLDVLTPTSESLTLDRQPYLTEHNPTYRVDSESLLSVIVGSVQAEAEAVSRYRYIARLADAAGYQGIEQDVKEIIDDEREHLDEMESYAREFTEGGEVLEQHLGVEDVEEHFALELPL